MAMTSALRSLTTTARREPQPARLPSAATIVVVEDDVLAAQSLVKALESDGYRTHIAATGSDARALQQQLQPDLIILDLMLPDIDGLVLLTTFKATRATTNTPIIVCSARHGQLDRVLALRLGAADFVSKPFDVDDLLARVEAVLSGVQFKGG